MLKSLRPLFPYLKKYRVGYAFAVLSVLLNNGIWILWPQVIRRAADDLEHKTPEAFDPARFREPFTHIVLDAKGEEAEMETGPTTENWVPLE